MAPMRGRQSIRLGEISIRARATLAGGLQMRRQGKSESREYKNGTSERSGSIDAAGAARPLENGGLARRYTPACSITRRARLFRL
jgi:hypothetical protein